MKYDTDIAELQAMAEEIYRQSISMQERLREDFTKMNATIDRINGEKGLQSANNTLAEIKRMLRQPNIEKRKTILH